MIVVIDEVSGLSEQDSVQIHFHLDRTSVVLTSQGLYTDAADRPNVELLYNSSMETRLEVGKISTANDVWHDSTLVHLNHLVNAEEETFVHCSLLIPHRAGESLSCAEFHQEPRENGFYISIRLKEDHTLFELFWNGETLIKL